MEGHRAVALFDVFVLRDKDDPVVVEIIEQGRGLVIYKADELVVGREAQPRFKHIRLFMQALLSCLTPGAFEVRSLLAYLCGKGVFIVDQYLSRRGEGYLLAVVGTALGLDVEVVDGVDLIAPQLYAHGRLTVGHEQVDDAASYRILSAALDVVAALVAEQSQRFFELAQVDLDVRFEHPRDRAQDIPGDGELVRRVESGDYDVVVAAEHTAEHVQAAVLILVRLDLHGDVDEIFLGIYQRPQTHRAKVVAHYLRFLLVLGNTKGSDGVFPAERRDYICFVYPRYADCGGSGAAFDGVIQLPELSRGADDFV